MSLINCPECRNEVSDKAESCPKCAYPINNGIPKIREKKDGVIYSKETHKSQAKSKYLLSFIVIISLFVVIWFAKEQYDRQLLLKYRKYRNNQIRLGKDHKPFYEWKQEN
jgi:hypothetical protein